MPPSVGLCSTGVLPVLSVSLVCMLHGGGRRWQGLGNWALELGGGI